MGKEENIQREEMRKRKRNSGSWKLEHLKIEGHALKGRDINDGRTWR